MELPPQWRRWATSDWVALAVERRAAGAEQDRVQLGLEPVRLGLVDLGLADLELVRLELVDRVLVDQVPQHVGLVPVQAPEGERVAAARCLAHPTRLAR